MDITPPLSLFQHFSKSTGTATLSQIIDIIRSDQYKGPVTEIRMHLDKQPSWAAKLKKNLPAFTPAGTFTDRRLPDFLDNYAQLLVLDFDKLSAGQIQQLRHFAADDPYCCAGFISPSGRGYKLFFQTDAGPQTHAPAFAQICSYLQAKWPPALLAALDTSGKDITRLCFLSFDPDAWISYPKSPFAVSSKDPSAFDQELLLQHLTGVVQEHLPYQEGNRNNFLYRVARKAHQIQLSPTDTLAFARKNFRDLEPAEIRSTVKSAFNKPDPQAKNSADLQGMEEQMLQTPLIPSTVYEALPNLIRQCTDHFTDPRERDVFLSGALAILSGCLPGISGRYDQRTTYANLFVFIIAPPAGGKGVLSYAKQLGDELHHSFLEENKQAKEQFRREQAAFRIQMAAYKKGNKLPTEPEIPPFKVLYIPADASSAMIIKHLRDNGGSGIMCETEADTIGNVLKQDWGGYSDLLRKAFHFERISYSRKGNSEYVEIDQPRLSLAISGTPSQIGRLIPSVEDGLFSRFLFYCFATPPAWRDVSPQNNGAIQHQLQDAAQTTHRLHRFCTGHPADFSLTDEQWRQLNAHFKQQLLQHHVFQEAAFLSSVKRMGSICFRLAMTLSAVRRLETQHTQPNMICTDEDFQTALQLADVYLQHALFLFEKLPNTNAIAWSNRPNPKLQLFQALPERFQRKDALITGTQLCMSDRSVDRLLKDLLNAGLLHQPAYGYYSKSDS